MHRKIRVGVVFGGRSSEHEVSLASAASVMNAMDRQKYDIVPIGITNDGRWIASGDPLKALQSGELAGTRPAALLGDPSWHGLLRLDDSGKGLAAAEVNHLDVVFPVLHGTYGEDGTVQGLLELANVPYVGADVLSSAVAMDKIMFKYVMTAHGIANVDSLWFRRKQWQNQSAGVLEAVEEGLGYPVFTKPANMGSSVGVSKCHNRGELADGLDEAARYDRKLLVEVAVPEAREIEVSVLGNDEPITSVPGEVVPSREFYSYEAKYIDLGESASGLLIPAPLSESMTAQVRELAIRAYRAIDCCGMARVDFLLPRSSGQLYINEMNTIPGFTGISMYPKLWDATGVSYAELIDRLIELAMERHSDNASSATSYQVQG